MGVVVGAWGRGGAEEGERGGGKRRRNGGSVLRLGHLVIRPTVAIGLVCVPLLARRPTARFPSFPSPLPASRFSGETRRVRKEAAPLPPLTREGGH